MISFLKENTKKGVKQTRISKILEIGSSVMESEQFLQTDV